MNDIERGRQLIEAGNLMPAKMADSLCVIAYRKSQRELVNSTGRCAARCQCEQVEHRGELLCPHTWEPCKTVVGEE